MVIDLGGSLCRAGYAGDDTPKAVLPSAVGIVSGSEANGTASGGADGGRSVFIGSEALSFKRDHMQVRAGLAPAAAGGLGGAGRGDGHGGSSTGPRRRRRRLKRAAVRLSVFAVASELSSPPRPIQNSHGPYHLIRAMPSSFLPSQNADRQPHGLR